MTVRVGFLGGGFIAHHHGKMLHTSAADARIAAVFDPDPAKAANFSARSGAAVVASEEELVAQVDAVYVTTWTSEHRRLVHLAADAGVAVFCEKPLATSVADAIDMVERVTDAGIINQVGLVLRDSPAFLFLRHLIARPVSGRVMTVVFRDDQFLPIQGMYDSDWRGDRTRAGSGTLLEHSIHDLDLLDWLFGPTISVSGRTQSFHAIEGIEDLAVASVDFASGGVATLTSVWHDVLARPSQRRVEVFCERALYVLEGDVDGPVRWTVDGGDGTTDEGSAAGGSVLSALTDAGIALRNPDQSFIEAVSARTPAFPDFATALPAHRLADAVYRSASDGGAPIMMATGV